MTLTAHARRTRSSMMRLRGCLVVHQVELVGSLRSPECGLRPTSGRRSPQVDVGGPLMPHPCLHGGSPPAGGRGQCCEQDCGPVVRCGAGFLQARRLSDRSSCRSATEIPLPSPPSISGEPPRRVLHPAECESRSDIAYTPSCSQHWGETQPQVLGWTNPWALNQRTLTSAARRQTSCGDSQSATDEGVETGCTGWLAFSPHGGFILSIQLILSKPNLGNLPQCSVPPR